LKKVTGNRPVSGRRGPGRPKLADDQTQALRIVQRARELFISKGYGGTTMDHVAAACHISKRTLYCLFQGKAELFAAIVDAHRQSMLALPANYDGLPIDQALEAIFIIDIDAEADRERVALLRWVTVEAAHFPELGAILRRHGGDRSRADLADWLDRQRARGLITIDDPHSAARMLMDMIFGAIIVKAVGDLEWPKGSQRRAHVRRCIKVFLNGVLPR
jgi:TetR/AcrR family transcriptional regulator, mexJK operon transcriptional repressor